MPYLNGAFSRLRSWVTDAAAGIAMLPNLMDQDTNDIALALNNCILRDGTGGPTTDIPWGDKKITTLADPVSPQDAVNLRTLQGSAGPANCQLSLSGSNLVLLPFDGNAVLVNGGVAVIPDAGLTLSPPGSTATLEYIYLTTTLTNGILVPSLVADTTPPCVQPGTGIAIKGPITNPDPTRRLVGAALTGADERWYDTAAFRYVRSYFNDPGVIGAAYLAQDAGQTYGQGLLPNTILALMWAGEVALVTSTATMSSNAANGGGSIAPAINNVGLTNSAVGGQSYGAGAQFSASQTGVYRTPTTGQLAFASVINGDGVNLCTVKAGAMTCLTTFGRPR